MIPSEDEWYKAAYHKNDGVTGNYWDYPTGTSAVPDNGIPEGDTGNSANFRGEAGDTIGAPHWRTPVGYFSSSDSPYGTLDQGGNVWELNETIVDGITRGMRGGTYASPSWFLLASDRYYYAPTSEGSGVGFRLALVPEPEALALLTLGGWLALQGRRR